MEKSEKEEDLRLSGDMTNDGKNYFIFEDNTESLISRISFYSDSELNFVESEKKELGDAMINAIFKIVANREIVAQEKNWIYKSEGFKEAYNVEPLKNKHSVTWLMTNILGIEKEEADRRYEIAKELKSHPDFKDKESIIIDKVYLNKSHLL